MMILENIEDAEMNVLWFGNTAISILVSNNQGVDGMSVVEHHMPYGEAPPLHVHETEDEIFYCLEGRMLFEIGGVPQIVTAGEAVLAPKGVPHRFRVVSPDGARSLTVTRGADFETMLRNVSRPPAHAGLPVAVAPTPAMIEGLTAACAANRIAIMGPPLG